MEVLVVLCAGPGQWHRGNIVMGGYLVLILAGYPLPSLTLPLPGELTNKSENITFPRTSHVGSNKFSK